MAGLHRGAFPQSQVPLIDRGSAYILKVDIDRVTLKLNLNKSAILLSAHITKTFISKLTYGEPAQFTESTGKDYIFWRHPVGLQYYLLRPTYGCKFIKAVEK